MKNHEEPKIITPKLERPTEGLRVRTGVRAGTRASDGGVTHTDKWRQAW